MPCRQADCLRGYRKVCGGVGIGVRMVLMGYPPNPLWKAPTHPTLAHTSVAHQYGLCFSFLFGSPLSSCPPTPKPPHYLPPMPCLSPFLVTVLYLARLQTGVRVMKCLPGSTTPILFSSQIWWGRCFGWGWGSDEHFFIHTLPVFLAMYPRSSAAPVKLQLQFLRQNAEAHVDDLT